MEVQEGEVGEVEEEQEKNLSARSSHLQEVLGEASLLQQGEGEGMQGEEPQMQGVWADILGEGLADLRPVEEEGVENLARRGSGMV